MRIVYVVHKLPPESIGGTEIHAASLARAMGARGHRVWLFAPYREARVPPVEGLEDGIHVVRVRVPTVPRHPVRALWTSIRDRQVEGAFRALLRTAQPDIVHFQHLQNVSIRLLAQADHLPRVLSLHDYWYICPNGQLLRPDRRVCETGASGWRCADCALARASSMRRPGARAMTAAAMALRNACVRRAAYGLDLYATPSEFARDRYVASGWEPDRIRVVELGVDEGRLRGAGTAVREHRLHIGYLGAIAWQKGLHILLAAFCRLPHDARLTIYGDESAFPEYAREIRSLAIHPGVHFAGRLEPSAVGAALRAMDYLVVPSLWYETFGMVVQEAHAVGTPTIVSRIGALARVRDGVDGWVFEPGDIDGLAAVLCEAYVHPELRQGLSASLRPGPTQAHQAALWESIYQDVVARRGRSRSPAAGN